jgi:hypothetical protein
LLSENQLRRDLSVVRAGQPFFNVVFPPLSDAFPYDKSDVRVVCELMRLNRKASSQLTNTAPEDAFHVPARQRSGVVGLRPKSLGDQLSVPELPWCQSSSLYATPAYSMQGKVSLLEQNRISVASTLSEHQMKRLMDVSHVVHKETKVNIVETGCEARCIVLNGRQDVDIGLEVVRIKGAGMRRRVVQRRDLLIVKSRVNTGSRAYIV